MKESPDQPIVALRPSTELTNKQDVYQVRYGVFKPTPENVTQMLEHLNKIKPGEQTGIHEIDAKIKPGLRFKSTPKITLSACENMAIDKDINILGGVFLEFINSHDLQPGETLGQARVESNDAEFMLLLYPDLQDYFLSPSTVSPERKRFAEGIVFNNSGKFCISEVNNESRLFLERDMQRLALLKRIFRHAVKTYVPWDEKRVRDNVVHTPENKIELSDHWEIFKRRIPR